MPKNPGLEHPTIAPYGSFTTLENKQILISVQNQREWETFCDRVLKKPGLKMHKLFLKNPDRVKNRADLNQIIDGVFSCTREKELIERLNEAGIAFGKINDVAALRNHPSGEIPSSTNKKRSSNNAWSRGKKELSTEKMLRIPDLNEHGERIRAEFSS